jgi:hypothetical protein
MKQPFFIPPTVRPSPESMQKEARQEEEEGLEAKETKKEKKNTPSSGTTSMFPPPIVSNIKPLPFPHRSTLTGFSQACSAA